MVDMDKMDAVIAAMINEKSMDIADLSAEVKKTNGEIQDKIRAIKDIEPDRELLERIRANSQKIASLATASV